MNGVVSYQPVLDPEVYKNYTAYMYVCISVTVQPSMI